MTVSVTVSSDQLRSGTLLEQQVTPAVHIIARYVERILGASADVGFHGQDHPFAGGLLTSYNTIVPWWYTISSALLLDWQRRSSSSRTNSLL